MPAYDYNKPQQSRINFFDLAGRTINLFEQEPLNAFDSIDAILLETEEPLEAYFWDEPQAVSPWNSYWTEAAANGGGLSIDDPVFKDSWTKYFGLHISCKNEDTCYCEHNCGGTHTTKGRAVSSSGQTEIPWDITPAKDFILFPTDSEVKRWATPSTTPSWTNYQQRKLDKGKAVDQEQHPAPRPIPLIIITQTNGHEVFVW
jgi:hypothetical protein